MPRPLWTGSISFGLVNVPVKIYSAVSKKDVRFHQLHDADGVRLQQKRVCPADGREVPYENVFKGYEIAPGRYVTITSEELAGLAPDRSPNIEIEGFVSLEQIDPLYFEHAYYLAPDKSAVKAYSLLLSAMLAVGKVAIGRIVMRSRAYLAAIRPLEGALALQTLLYGDEVVPYGELEELSPGNLPLPDQRELEVATQLVEALTTDYDPADYQDDYRLSLLDLIERKASGEEITVQPPVERPAAKVIDLVGALEKSLDEIERRKGTRGRAERSA